MYNISEIKKLPEKEKLKIIEEIWASIDKIPPGIYSKKEEEALLIKRMEDIKSGKEKSESWSVVKKRLLNKSTARVKNP